jgi:hypothetical protein
VPLAVDRDEGITALARNVRDGGIAVVHPLIFFGLFVVFVVARDERSDAGIASLTNVQGGVKRARRGAAIAPRERLGVTRERPYG